jgi:hypothetical protein
LSRVVKPAPRTAALGIVKIVTARPTRTLASALARLAIGITNVTSGKRRARD